MENICFGDNEAECISPRGLSRMKDTLERPQLARRYIHQALDIYISIRSLLYGGLKVVFKRGMPCIESIRKII